jgi:hypothetical protein
MEKHVSMCYPSAQQQLQNFLKFYKATPMISNFVCPSHRVGNSSTFT